VPNLDDLVLCSLKDLQRLAYRIDSNDNVAQNVVGSLIATGISSILKVTPLTVTSTAQKAPATILIGRNSLKITNFSETDTVYISTDPGIVAGRTGDGDEIFPGESWNEAITDTGDLYLITESGKTADIKVVEKA
jgi:hypothetical protein